VNVRIKPRVTVVERDLPFECIALVQQGGGALGADQAGVHEALAEAGIYLDWVAGISIGVVNCAIIAGNHNPLGSRRKGNVRPYAAVFLV
jgi:NTE family protein